MKTTVKPQLLLAAWTLLAALLPASSAFAGKTSDAYSLSYSATAPNIGNVSSGAPGKTVFQVDAATGNVSIVSGNGAFVPAGAVRNALTTITINCTGNGACGSSQATVTIAAGSTTGRAQPITAFAIDTTGLSTPALLTSGATSASGASPLTFTIQPVGKNSSVSFNLGLSLPIASSGQIGTATAAYSITVTGTNVTTGLASPAANANVQAPLTLTKNSDLSFATLVRTAGQSGSYLFPAAGHGGYSVSGGTVIHTPTLGQFTLVGSAGQAVTVSVPSSLTLTDARGDTLPITVSNTAQGLQVLDSNGTLVFYVGGAFSFTPTTPSGAYTAVFAVTASYN